MTAIERLIEAKSATYTEMREILRGKARAYALERVGGSPTNQRARTMLAAAFDAGVSAMVERARDALILDEDDEQDSSGYDRAMEAMFAYCLAVGEQEVIETIEALSEGRAKIIAVLPPVAVGASAPDDRTSVLRGRAPSGEGSLGVAPIESENERENIDGDVGGYGDPTIVREEEHVWEVGEYCVWTMHPEYGSARIKWLGSRDVVYDGEGYTKRCKLYFERLDRVEEAYVCELELIEVS
jgi:hypothetical protein